MVTVISMFVGGLLTASKSQFLLLANRFIKKSKFEPKLLLYRKELACAQMCQLMFFKVFQGKFYKINYLVKTCVKVGRNGFYSEGLYPTTARSTHLNINYVILMKCKL